MKILTLFPFFIMKNEIIYNYIKSLSISEFFNFHFLLINLLSGHFYFLYLSFINYLSINIIFKYSLKN